MKRCAFPCLSFGLLIEVISNEPPVPLPLDDVALLFSLLFVRGTTMMASGAAADPDSYLLTNTDDANPKEVRATLGSHADPFPLALIS